MDGDWALEQPGVPPANASKSLWREWARERRASMSGQTVGGMAARALAEWPVYRSATRILVYLAFGGEPDLSTLLNDHSKSFYTTRTEDAGEPALTLHRLDPDALERHRFGFLQPFAAAGPVHPDGIELALVPGLAFDVRGARLGFGMGYYDRLLGVLDQDAPRVGVAPSALIVPELPSEEHDVPMTHIVTENGVFPALPSSRT